MKYKTLIMIKDQAYHTMAIVGTMASTIYVMRWLGFNEPLPWRYDLYPSYVVGIFLGFVIRAYFDEEQECMDAKMLKFAIIAAISYCLTVFIIRAVGFYVRFNPVIWNSLYNILLQFCCFIMSYLACTELFMRFPKTISWLRQKYNNG